MAVHRIKKGLDLPLAGAPRQEIDQVPATEQVAIVAADFPGLKPTMNVRAGDRVRRGELLFEDKRTRGVRFTAPGAGEVVAVNRGDKRALQSVVIALGDAERAGKAETIPFEAFSRKTPTDLNDSEVADLLLESGMWTALRTRPYAKVADPVTRPRSIFVTAVDSEPLAADPRVVLKGREADFETGLQAVGQLTEGTVFVCSGGGFSPPMPKGERFRNEQFEGPHPSGLAGFHIHTLDPVDRKKLVWYLGYQDVIAIGRLFADGSLDVDRVISLAGPVVPRARLVRTRIGASIDELIEGEVADDEDEVRTISGSVLSGRAASGGILGFLGRYDSQISIVAEDRRKEFLGWMAPGVDRYSTTRSFLSSFFPRKLFAMTSSTNGSDRAVVPIGVFEKVFPYDILPTFLLKAVLVGDIEQAEALGVLELAEEDVGLCSFVSPGKEEFGAYLRDVLTTIEKDG